ncbi:MAG: circadian clock protein KaiA [Cyanobacteriota bacterium]|nr:circadian clock protein KaiA [Cyanobacteriota bacterium]
MSEPQPEDLPVAAPVPALTIASLILEPRLQAACSQWLRGGRHDLVTLSGVGAEGLVQELERRSDQVDAVLLQQGAIPSDAYQALIERGLMLPAVVIGEVIGRIEYHQAEVHLPPDQLEQLSYSLDAAISRLLRTARVAGTASSQGETPESWKLANRLRGRLGYLGVFYKRDPSRFLRNLPSPDRRELLASLTRTYRDLLLSYFRDPAAANQALESFVNTAFFSDLPITQTVEIHMNLIDEFWKQLKLEGHKNDFLQDYRLALLDVMAHLCEMYRRSIPPDAPLGMEAGLVAARPGDALSLEDH